MTHGHWLPFQAEQSYIRLKTSRGYLECPVCGERRYIGQEAIRLATLQSVEGVRAVIVHHVLCDAAMKSIIFPESVPDPLTPFDLDRVFICCQDETGAWITVDAQSATDAQFDAWARTCVTITIGGSEVPWPPVERVEFCDRLYLLGRLHLRKCGERFDEREGDQR